MCGCVPIQPPAAPEAAPRPALVLDAASPVTRLPVPASLLESPSAVLEVPVEGVENAAMIPFSIAVFLEWSPPGGSPRRAEVGRFSVQPSDRAGRYALDATGAFAQAAAEGGAEMALVFELEPLREGQALDGLRVQLGPVEWR
jgi:hypothetical protein